MIVDLPFPSPFLTTDIILLTVSKQHSEGCRLKILKRKIQLSTTILKSDINNWLTQNILLWQPVLYQDVFGYPFQLGFVFPDDSGVQPSEGLDEEFPVPDGHSGASGYGPKAEVHGALRPGTVHPRGQIL